MKQETDNFLDGIAVTLLLAQAVTFNYMFFNAFFNVMKTHLVRINYYGEANFEFVLNIIIICFVAWRMPSIYGKIKEARTK